MLLYITRAHIYYIPLIFSFVNNFRDFYESIFPHYKRLAVREYVLRDHGIMGDALSEEFEKIPPSASIAFE